MPRRTTTTGIASDQDVAPAEQDLYPQWFVGFLDDRQTRKPSAHTMKAYRQDFVAIASIITDGRRKPADQAPTKGAVGGAGAGR